MVRAVVTGNLDPKRKKILKNRSTYLRPTWLKAEDS